VRNELAADFQVKSNTGMTEASLAQGRAAEAVRFLKPMIFVEGADPIRPAAFHEELFNTFGYRIPGNKLYGKPMLYLAGFKEHYPLFAASGTFFAVLEEELRGYELRKGTVRFPLTRPVPVKPAAQ
jgi:hypothetical protein